jgi:hypothetical protein
MKIVIIIFNIIINIIVIENRNEKELSILRWFNLLNWIRFNLIQRLFKSETEHVEWNQNIPVEI